MCYQCTATLADLTTYSYEPYFTSDGDQSCLIIGCVETDPEDDEKCIACESSEGDLFVNLAKFQGICVPDCVQVEGANLRNDERTKVCDCIEGFFQTNDYQCLDCPFDFCSECDDNMCKYCDTPIYNPGSDSFTNFTMHPNHLGCIPVPLPNCQDAFEKFGISQDGYYECLNCADGFAWSSFEHACVPCYDIPQFENGMCTRCHRQSNQ